MAVLGAAQERAILCIEEFYPVFDSAGAKIVKAELEPVSYTHLDVYKRQLPIRDATLFWLPPPW